METKLLLKKVPPLVDRFASLILIALASLVILTSLGNGSLVDWDEAIYAQVAREIIQNGNWVTLSHGYQPYFEKPPLLMWSIVASYKLFGVNEFSARLPSAIAGILLVYTTYLCGRTIYGSRTGFLAGLILLSCFGFVYQSRNGTTNIPLTLFVFTGFYAHLRLKQGSQKWWYLLFVSFSLAFMVKFWAGLVLPAAVFVSILVDGKLRVTLLTRQFWLGFLLAAAIILPWHILVYLQNGQVFLDVYVNRNLMQRTFTTLEGHFGSTLFYLDVLRSYLAPWYFLVPFAIAQGIKEIFSRQKTGGVLIFLVFFVFGLYTFVVNTKLEIYILPILPAFAILIAHLFVLDASSSNTDNFLFYLVSAGLISTLVAQNKLLILFILAGLMLVVMLKTRILSVGQMPQVTASLIFTGFVMIGTVGYIQGNNRLVIWAVYESPNSPVSQIATFAGNYNPSIDMPIIGYDPQEKNREPLSAVEGPAATFYSNRPVIVAKTWEQFVEQMEEEGSGEVLVAEEYLNLLTSDFNLTVIKTVPPLVYARFSQ
jgi:4-amino-4-deoxy-L-arabinose transferase-like glycosyltransferase